MSKGLLIIGGLLAIILLATDATLALKRLFPDVIALNFVGPVLSVVGAGLFTWYLKRRN